jgi:spore germination cell wall hydrolase CwlJ-like protein
LKEADRKLASALVVATWAAVAAAIGGTLFSVSDSKTALAAVNAKLSLGADSPQDVVKEAALAVQRETRCLTDVIYHEARSEPEAGQIAVAEVVLNRVSSGHYADTICGVVYQGAERITGCQFSFTCDGSMNLPIETAAWTRAERVAHDVILGHKRNIVGTATHYHAEYVDPYWAAAYGRSVHIGKHIFYSDEPKDRG